MKKGQNKGLLITLAVLVVLVGILFIWSFTRPTINRATGNVVNEGLKTTMCEHDYNLKVIDEKWTNVIINHDCYSINGGVREGDAEILINVENPNEIPLSIPCHIGIHKVDFNTQPSTVYDKKQIKDFIIDVNPKSSNTIKENFYLPRCYGWAVECKDINELPGCSN